MFLHLFFLVLFIAAIFLFVLKPLQKKGISETVEVGVATLLVVSSLLYLGLMVVGPSIAQDEIDNKPCGKNTFESKCYNLSYEACQAAWNHYEQTCWQDAKSKQQSASQLLGSGVQRCTKKLFDKYMSFNRRMDEQSGCMEYFKNFQE